MSSDPLYSEGVSESSETIDTQPNSQSLQIDSSTLQALVQLAASQNKESCTVQWDKDDNGSGKTSIYILVSWLTEDGNYERYKSNKSTKIRVAEEIEEHMVKNGITWRSASVIISKIDRLEIDWRKADEWRGKTGAGVWKKACERKEKERWSDDNPEWHHEKDGAIAPILKACQYYFELMPIFQARHGNSRLAAESSEEHNSLASMDDLLPRVHRGLAMLNQNRGPEVEVDDDVQSGRRDAEKQSQESLAQDAASLARLDGDYEVDVDPPHPLLEDAGGDDEYDVGVEPLVSPDNLTNQGIDTFTDSPALQPQSASASMNNSGFQTPAGSSKRSISVSSIPPTNSIPASKRKKSSGSASQITELLKDKGVSPFANHDANKASLNLEHELLQHQQASLDRLSRVAESFSMSLAPAGPSTSLLTSEQANTKAKMEIEMASINLETEKEKLAEMKAENEIRKMKRNMELRSLQSELIHQEITRNAQLIATLMNDHNLSREDAIAAAASASANVSSTNILAPFAALGGNPGQEPL
ncbi:hypothetical protein DFH28DRAFT_936969 [Melampsora americana]|nr:hypothetical protein DFH28DRAFT_936969 [Melampsora americana]